MSRPWMPIYIDDYLADTKYLSAAEHGAYLLLMMEYWIKGDLPTDDETLARIVSASLKEWEKIKPVVAKYFTDDWRHIKLDVERAKKRTGGIFGVPPAIVSNPLPVDWRERRQIVFARDDFTCTYCGQRGGRLECDHITPRSKSGTHDFDNLTTACRKCNRDKRDQMISEWMQ